MKTKLTFLLTALLLMSGLISWAQGHDDFSTLTANASYNTKTTTAGWVGNNVACFQGGASNSSPTFTMIGSTDESKAMCINGKTTAVGTITSPTLTGGCGSLTLKYGYVFSEANGVDFTIYIQQDGTAVKTFQVDDNDIAQHEAGTFTEAAVNVEGDFVIFIQNNSPTNSTSNKDRTCIWDIEWTAYGSGGGQETVATPTFSPAAGVYTEAQTVSINCATAGATIRYTLDGSDPTARSYLYSEPLTISETTTITAKAWKEGYYASGIISASYTIDLPEGNVFTRIANHNVVSGGTYMIVDVTTGKALTSANGTGSAPTAVAVTIDNDQITTSDTNLQWTVVSTDGGYIIYPLGSTETWLYTTNANNGVRIGDNEANVWTLNVTDATQTNYHGMKHNGTERFLGVYNNQDWRAYTSVNNNIKETQIEFFGLGDVPTPSNPQLTASVSQITGLDYIAGQGPSAAQSFTLSGQNLTTDVMLVAPEYFQVSRINYIEFSDTLVLTPQDGTLAQTTIYVWLNEGNAPNTYSGNLAITSGTANVSIALSGVVSEMDVVATPVFAPAGGSYITPQSVTITCDTEGAAIYYTLDGTEPTVESTVYSGPISVTNTTTIKAMAAKSGSSNSAIATATYTIPTLINIAEARALANNEYALVEGIVTFIDGRNIYIQDGTAGIDLYLNSGTVPTTLALGDEVRTYGKKTSYNGLVELTGINGGSASEFTIVSSENELPNAVKTIAEILADFSANNLLQATRVTIETATIGTINATGSTAITQEGSSINVYRIPVPEGMIAGDWVTLTAIVSCNNNTPQLRVASVDDIEFTHRPIITFSPSTVSGFTYEYEQGGPSEILQTVVAGDHLRGRVEIYPSENFEISTSGDDMFHSENPAIIYPPTSGHFYGLKLYCRMKAGLEPGTYNELQAGCTQDGDTVYVRLIGSVTGGVVPPTPPTGDGYVRIADLGQLTDGSQVVFAARYDSDATNYVALQNTLDNGKMQSTEFTSAISGSDEVLPADIADVDSQYYWTVSISGNNYSFTNANGDVIAYNSGTNFNFNGDKNSWTIEAGTADPAAMVPSYQGFLIKNVATDTRAFAINSNYHSCGAYATSNMTGTNAGSYNFFLDLFVKSEGGATPTVSTPTFTPAAGTYYEAQNVTITCATEGATIYYTLDGTDPTAESDVYSEPIAIDETTTVKAIAMKEGYNNSGIAEATYTIQLGVVVIFNQDWEGEMNGWTFVDVEGAAVWTINQYSGNHYAYVNGYNQGANEDWCISPAFNLNAYDNPSLSFKTAKNYNGNDIEVFFSNNYDGSNPANATWTPLTCELSTGSWTWVESGAIDLSSFSGSNCYIGFKYTCTADAAAGWEVDDCLLVGQTTEPVISVSPLTLNGFTYIENNGPSAEQSFNVSGLNLSNNLIIANDEYFEISLGSGDDFDPQTTISLTPSNGTIEETTIYVRMIAGLEIGDYDGTIAIESEGATSVEISCGGSVIEEGGQGGDYVRIVSAEELVDGNRVILAARYNDNATSYVAITNVLASGKLNTTEFTSMMSGDDEIIPANIVASENDYYWTVGVTANGYTFTNANGDVIGYGTSGTNFSMNSDKTEWIVATAVSDTNTMVPSYYGFNVINYTTTGRAFALNSSHVCGAYSTSNMTGSNAPDYNFYLDIFMQGEAGTPTVANPTFTPAAGTYFEAQEVSISCATADADIYYSLVSENGPWDAYTETITVDDNMTIWAYAEKEGYNNSAVVSADYIINDDIVIIFNQDWEDDWNGWTEVSVEGETAEWTIAEHSGNHYAYMNAYNQGANEDWLISPAFDLDANSNVVLNFKSAMNYTGPDVEVYFSNDYDGQDPTAATWQALACNLSQGSWTWTESGEISLDAFSGSNCYIAFKYTSTETEAAGWEIDDIILTSGMSTDPTLMVTPNNIYGLTYIEGEGPSEAQTYTISATNLEGEGEVMILVTEGFEISLDDEAYGEELELAYADGQIVDQPVTIYVRLTEGLEMGTYDGVIMHEGGDAYNEVNLAGEVLSADQPYIDAFMPMYIQGNNGTNNNRVPVAIAVYLENLEANTTYRYVNQFVDGNDGPETNGAGNVIYADLDGFYRTTSPSLSTEGGYGEFTTDEYGEGFIWCINEPTANTRFTPGNEVYLRVRINDGHDGTTVDQIFTTEDAATVLNFGEEYDNYAGSSFIAISNEAPMTFAMMFSDDYDFRPTYSTSIETTGVDYGSINQYADFYKEEVAGKNGYFGGILPNDNKDGINIIWILDIESYVINDYYAEEGQWASTSTSNPNNGLANPMIIDLTDDGVEEGTISNVKVWAAGNEIRIDNPDGESFVMTVTNILGQNVMMQNVNGEGLIRINHNLTSGLYIVTLQNTDNKVAAKIIVK